MAVARPLRRQDRALEASLRTVAQLLGHDNHNDHVLRHPRSIAVRARLGSLIKLTPRHLEEEVDIELSGYLRLVAGMVATNRPWRVALTLTRSVAVALATVAFAVVTTDIWVLASGVSTADRSCWNEHDPVGHDCVGPTARIVGRSRGRETSQAQVRLFNLATSATVAIGFVALYAILVTVALIAAVVLIDSGTLVEVTGRENVGVAEYAALAWFGGSLATLGAAVGGASNPTPRSEKPPTQLDRGPGRRPTEPSPRVRDPRPCDRMSGVGAPRTDRAGSRWAQGPSIP